MEQTMSKWRNVRINQIMIFIAYDYLLIMKIDEEGHKTFTYAWYNAIAKSKGRLLLYLYGKGKKNEFSRVIAILWLQSWYHSDFTPFNLFTEDVSREPCSVFFSFYHLIYA